MNRILRAAQALGVRRPKNVRQTLSKIAALLVALTGLAFPQVAGAATLSPASVALSDPRVSQTGVTYTVSVQGQTTGTAIGCISATFVQNDLTSTIGSPFSVAGATATSNLVSNVNWTSSVSSNTVKFTNSVTTETPASGTKTFTISGVNNGSSVNTDYYILFRTYVASACTGTAIDTVNVGFIYDNGSLLSLTVNGTLSFTVSGEATPGTTQCNGATSSSDGSSTSSAINFGSVSTSKNSIVCQHLSAATNAANGYSIYLRDTGQAQNALTQTLANWSGSYGSPSVWSSDGTTGTVGTEGYGYTTNGETAFTTGGPKWSAINHSANEAIAFSAGPTASGTAEVGFQAGINGTTNPGTYTTTVIYTCTPVY